MAIQFDFSTDAVSTDGTATFSHTCTGLDRIIFISAAAVDTFISTATYANTGMTKITSQVDGNLTGDLWYLANPPVGANDVDITWNTTTQRHVAVVSHSYTGVDVNAPLGESQTAATNTVDITAQAGWMVVDCFADQSGSAPSTPGADQTLVSGIRQGGSAGDSNACANASYELGSALTTMSWTAAGAGGDYSATLAVALKPKGTAKARAVKYFHDIYDPGGRIFNDLGQVVSPWELKPNNWIKVTGLFLPTSKEYSTFVQDPTMAYIEEVTFSARGGLRIKTNRGEMTDVLLARAAGGKTL